MDVLITAKRDSLSQLSISFFLAQRNRTVVNINHDSVGDLVGIMFILCALAKQPKINRFFSFLFNICFLLEHERQLHIPSV